MPNGVQPLAVTCAECRDQTRQCASATRSKIVKKCSPHYPYGLFWWLFKPYLCVPCPKDVKQNPSDTLGRCTVCIGLLGRLVMFCPGRPGCFVAYGQAQSFSRIFTKTSRKSTTGLAPPVRLSPFARGLHICCSVYSLVSSHAVTFANYSYSLNVSTLWE